MSQFGVEIKSLTLIGKIFWNLLAKNSSICNRFVLFWFLFSFDEYFSKLQNCRFLSRKVVKSNWHWKVRSQIREYLKHPLFFRYLICKSEFKTLGTIKIVGPHPNYARKILKVAAWNLFTWTSPRISIGPGSFIPGPWTLFIVPATALWANRRRTITTFTFCNKKV